MKRITRHCLFPVCFCFFCPVNAILPAVTQEIHQRWCRLYRCSCLESRASGPWTPHELRSWLLTFSESRAFCPSGFCPCPLWSVPFRASPLMGAGSHSRVQSGPRGVVSVCLHPGRKAWRGHPVPWWRIGPAPQALQRETRLVTLFETVRGL